MAPSTSSQASRRGVVFGGAHSVRDLVLLVAHALSKTCEGASGLGWRSCMVGHLCHTALPKCI